MLGLGTVNQNDSIMNECNKRVTAMRFRVIGALEKMNPEEMTLNDLAKYAALLSSVGILFPYAGYTTDACYCESKEV